MIKPTIGRRVWYRPSEGDLSPLSGFASNGSQPHDAGICYVHTDRMVNVTVADHNGDMHKRTSVPLLQEGDERPAHGGFCEWMPYQQGQTTTEQQVRMAAQLYEARDAARGLLGENYPKRMAEMGAAIKHVAKVKAISELSAATELAKQTSGFGVLIVLAAYVEMTEPSTQPAMP